MNRHLPSMTESVEILALGLMVGGLQWTIGSWSWSIFFILGFVWNWAVLNGWVMGRVGEKKYRFSMLKGIAGLNQLLMAPLKNYPRLQAIAQVLPAGIAVGLLALTFGSSVPWWATFFGSLAFLLVRRQLAELLR